MSQREELARAAGFFNGEGHIRHEITPTGHGIRLTVSQAGELDDGVPEDLLQFLKTLGRGRIRGPYWNAWNASRLPMWTYSVGKIEEVKEVIELLRPWLSYKKTVQVDESLEAWCSYKHERNSTQF